MRLVSEVVRLVTEAVSLVSEAVSLVSEVVRLVIAPFSLVQYRMRVLTLVTSAATASFTSLDTSWSRSMMR